METATVDTEKIEAEEDPEQLAREARGRAACWAFLLLTLVLVLLLYLLFGQRTFGAIHRWLSHLVRPLRVSSVCILMMLQVPFGTILFLPGLAYFNVLQAFLMKDVLAAWMISFFGGYLTSLGVFLFTRACCIDSVRKRFRHFEPYQMLLEETNSHPIRDGILFNVIFIPANVKNYVTAISDLSFGQAAIAFVPGPLVLCFFCSMVGNEVNSLSDVFSSKSFSEKSFWQKLNFIVSILLTVLTLAFLVAIGLYYKKRYKEFQRRKENSTDPDLRTTQDIL